MLSSTVDLIHHSLYLYLCERPWLVSLQLSSTLFHGGSLFHLDHNTLTVLVHGSLTVEIGLSALYPIPISGLHELLLILHVLESKLMPQRGLRLSENSEDHIPDHILRRVKDVGFVVPTDVQQKALPILLSGHDCIVHAQYRFWEDPDIPAMNFFSCKRSKISSASTNCGPH
ncbi:unnamed protein product [Camellia sinensis]